MTAVLLAAGCAGLSDEQCLTAVWSDIGYMDGTTGALTTRLSEHADACASAGVAPDATAWSAGYETGLDQYCTALNGVSLGAEGASYAGACTGQRAQAFVPAYRDGQAYRALRDAYRNAQYQRAQNTSSASRVRTDINNYNSDLANVNVTAEQRAAAEAGRAAAVRHREDLEDQGLYLTGEILRLDRELEELGATLAARYPGWRP